MSAQGQKEPDDIIEQVVKEHKDLADFRNDPKLKFEVYKLTIEMIFTTLKDNDLSEFPIKSLQGYKIGLFKISGDFYELYGNPTQNRLKKDFIQPKIDGAYRKLSVAMSYIKGESMNELKGSDLDQCLDYILNCRELLFQLKEYLITIEFDKP